MRSLRSTVDAVGAAVIEDVHDLDHLAEVTGHLRPNHITLENRYETLDASMRSVTISDDLSVHHLTYGCEVTVVPEQHAADSFLISLVMGGRSSSDTGRRRCSFDRGPQVSLLPTESSALVCLLILIRFS